MFTSRRGAVDGCRKRATPSSFRFLGPKVYVATLMILLTVLQLGPTEGRPRRLAAETATARLDSFHRLILDDLAYVSKDQAETPCSSN
jgi:hypothetical protein